MTSWCARQIASEWQPPRNSRFALKKALALAPTNTDSPEKIVKDKGLVQITDTKAIEGIVDEVIANNQKAVDDYKGGNKKAIGALVGQVMKASKGKANPQMVNKLLAEKLG